MSLVSKSDKSGKEDSAWVPESPNAPTFSPRRIVQREQTKPAGGEKKAETPAAATLRKLGNSREFANLRQAVRKMNLLKQDEFPTFHHTFAGGGADITSVRVGYYPHLTLSMGLMSPGQISTIKLSDITFNLLDCDFCQLSYENNGNAFDPFVNSTILLQYLREGANSILRGPEVGSLSPEVNAGLRKFAQRILQDVPAKAVAVSYNLPSRVAGSAEVSRLTQALQSHSQNQTAYKNLYRSADFSISVRYERDQSRQIGDQKTNYIYFSNGDDTNNFLRINLRDLSDVWAPSEVNNDPATIREAFSHFSDHCAVPGVKDLAQFVLKVLSGN